VSDRVRSAPVVVLDIGSTLVTGPDESPATRIGRSLGLADNHRRTLQHALMTRPFNSPGAVADFVRSLHPDSAVDQVVGEVWSAQTTEAQPLPGALEALIELRDHGVRLALLSNIWLPYLQSVRSHFGAFFDEHIPPPLQRFSFQAGHEKPTPALFQDVLHAAEVTADRAAMIGDSYRSDIEPAVALGMKTVWILERPAREVADIVRVLDGAAAPPSRTLARIDAVDACVVKSLWEDAVA
jgi:HAD superfamily hydrolase (TIGR01509 family)